MVWNIGTKVFSFQPKLTVKAVYLAISAKIPESNSC